MVDLTSPPAPLLNISPVLKDTTSSRQQQQWVIPAKKNTKAEERVKSHVEMEKEASLGRSPSTSFSFTKMEVTSQLKGHNDLVNSLQAHPTEPWICSASSVWGPFFSLDVLYPQNCEDLLRSVIGWHCSNLGY